MKRLAVSVKGEHWLCSFVAADDHFAGLVGAVNPTMWTKFAAQAAELHTAAIERPPVISDPSLEIGLGW